jgi:RNA polymerase sigma-70 factor (ECF subfamily)
MAAGPDEQLIRDAQAGDRQALGQLLQQWRPYLRQLAQRQLDSCLAARVDPSDVIQQTCLDAMHAAGDFRGSGLEELRAWLRGILEHNVADLVRRHVVAQKRTARREQPLGGVSEHASDGWQGPAAEQSSPSGRAIRDEVAARLADQIAALPPDQRDAIRLRYLEGRSLKEMARYFERSETAVAGLLKRGLQSLRQRSGQPESRGD